MGFCYALICARQPDLAKPRAQELLEIARDADSAVGELYGYHYLGDCALQQTNHSLAEEHYRHALAVAWQIGHTTQAESELLGIAMALAGQSKNGQALQLAAAVTSHRATENALPGVPFWDELQDHYFERARTELGHMAAKEASREGETLSIEQAITQTLDANPNEQAVTR